MAKQYIKGASYKGYLNTASQSTPTWVFIKQMGDIDLATNPEDVKIPERGTDDGHLKGERDPEISFNLMEDAGDTNIETMIAALDAAANTLVEIAIARGDITVTGTKFWRQESCLMGVKLAAKRGDVAQYDVSAKRHGNSDYAMTRNTAS